MKIQSFLFKVRFVSHIPEKRVYLIPLCIVCNESLSNHTMNLSLLIRHFELKHEDLKNKTMEFFQRTWTELSASKQKIASFSKLNEKWLHASYKVNLKIAKAGKLHTIRESLLLPSDQDRVHAVLWAK